MKKLIVVSALALCMPLTAFAFKTAPENCFVYGMFTVKAVETREAGSLNEEAMHQLWERNSDGAAPHERNFAKFRTETIIRIYNLDLKELSPGSAGLKTFGECMMGLHDTSAAD